MSLTCLERAYIIWPSAGTLAAGVHIVADTLGACIY